LVELGGKERMTTPDKTVDHNDSVDSTEGDVGDVVEMAGETTAASLISGPTDTRPAGADTLAKVDDTRSPAECEKN
jgi:hypothetical protein